MLPCRGCTSRHSSVQACGLCSVCFMTRTLTERLVLEGLYGRAYERAAVAGVGRGGAAMKSSPPPVAVAAEAAGSPASPPVVAVDSYMNLAQSVVGPFPDADAAWDWVESQDGAIGRWSVGAVEATASYEARHAGDRATKQREE